MTDFHDLNDADRDSLYAVACPACGGPINPKRPDCHTCDDGPDHHADEDEDVNPDQGANDD
jgi:uncharacterized OB-fold protein